MELPRGIDGFGLVHYDSLAKHAYIWPVCGTSYLCLKRTSRDAIVTCIECVARHGQYYVS